MKSTMDGAGRGVAPEAVREQAWLCPGLEPEVSLRDGHVEIGRAVYDAWLAATAVQKGATLLTIDAPATATYRAVGLDHRFI